MAKISVASTEELRGTSYPAPFDKPSANRLRRRLAEAGGLEDFGVNLLTIPPGTWSSQRHWHATQDEFVYILSGEVVLVTNAGEETMRAGDCAAFPKGAANGHHLINRSNKPATCLEIGTHGQEKRIDYPDIDLLFDGDLDCYTHRDGTLYSKTD